MVSSRLEELPLSLVLERSMWGPACVHVGFFAFLETSRRGVILSHVVLTDVTVTSGKEMGDVTPKTSRTETEQGFQNLRSGCIRGRGRWGGRCAGGGAPLRATEAP